MPRKKPTTEEIIEAPVAKSKPAAGKAAPKAATHKPAVRRAAKKEAAPAAPASQAFDAVAAHGEIARLAYQLFEARGCTPGSDMDDWLRAEAEIRARLEQPAAKATAV